MILLKPQKRAALASSMLLCRHGNILRKSWITIGILKSIEHKEALYKLWRLNKTSTVLKKEYKIYEKILNEVIKKAEYLYEVSMAEKSCKDIEGTWAYMNSKLGNRKEKSSEIGTIVTNDTSLTGANTIVEEINRFYTNIGHELASQMNSTHGYGYSRILPYSKSIFLMQVTNVEVTKLILELKDRGRGRRLSLYISLVIEL